jgi:hypothetical protein
VILGGTVKPPFFVSATTPVLRRQTTFSTRGFIYSEYTSRQNLSLSQVNAIILLACCYKQEKASVMIPSFPEVGDLRALAES